MTESTQLLARVSEILARAEKATPGEWVWVEKDSIGRSGVWSNRRPDGDSDAVPSFTEWLICETRHRSSTDPATLWPFKFGENGECDGEFLAHSRSDIPALCHAVRGLAQALESVMIGGNHLANQLIAQAACMPYRDTSYEEQLSLRGETYADIWVCWKAIMDARDRLLGEVVAKDGAK